MTLDSSTRSVPPMGGMSLTLARIELRRMLRNRRLMIFTLAMPIVLYLLFGASASNQSDATASEIAAYVLVSMGVYGSVLATTSGGAMVSTERAAGWSRQLRLTPLSPTAYVLLKLGVAMVLGLLSILAVYVVGLVTGKPDLSAGQWIACGLISWIGSLVFAAFGLFMGYLLPTENVMQILGPSMAILALVGGLFAPIQEGSTLDHWAQLTPMYGLGHLARYPLDQTDFHVMWIVNIVIWLGVFTAGAIWRFRRDTARV